MLRKVRKSYFPQIKISDSTEIGKYRICTELVRTWQCGAVDHFSLTPFDPLLVHGGFDDRCIDALVGTCATLSRYYLMSDTIAATISGSDPIFQNQVDID